jgi:hypothetical protein
MLSAFRFIAGPLLMMSPALIAEPNNFSLPVHRGAAVLDLDGFEIVQSSAKPGGTEIGIRLHNASHASVLIFLFLTPKTPHGNASGCRDAELQQVKKGMASNFKDAKLNPFGKDNDSVASMLVEATNSEHLYSFRGVDDQCLSMEVYSDPQYHPDLDKASSLLSRQSYDPQYVPTSKDKFIFAEILYRTKQYKAAAPIYSDFLQLIPNDKAHLMQRRIATDNMGMSLGISGDVEAARKVLEKAAAEDPDYPLNYYNLACADAEQGNAKDARTHLQQAFDRKANTLPGEKMPDPTQDDSIQKLKNDKPFWTFVQTLR